MRIAELAKRLGGDVNGRWINIPGPGHSRRDRSLGILLDRKESNALRIHSLAGDDLVDCRDHVRARLQAISKDGSFRVEGDTGVDDNAAPWRGRIFSALKIWEQSFPPHGTIVETYLATRGCLLSPSITAAETLRFHPCCPFGPGNELPAMIALMRDVITGEPRGIHRTALKEDGTGKRAMPRGSSPKMMLGIASDAAIRLQPASSLLGIAEGIETAFSASQIFGVPVWAVMSAGGVSSLPVLKGLRRLIIFADHDAAGLQAARRCAWRHAKAGTDVEVRYPPTLNSDWNTYQLVESA
ncbi:toprim domain-containing protein [Mesorhizobium sp. M1312]|uniref:DUF7146 domain-containing protein n=1 Tax=unclassified Mesorhizobium TaxID=325217 RepID=UPI00333887D4